MNRNEQLLFRLNELSKLEDGWFEGEGLALHKEGLEKARKALAQYPDDLSLPSVFPTQEGNLLLEWSHKGDPSLEIDLKEMVADFHCFTKDGEDLWDKFSLSGKDDWEKMFEKIGEIFQNHPPKLEIWNETVNG